MTLIAHAGAYGATRQDVEAVKAPPPTATWFPISHGDALALAETLLAQSGFKVREERYALTRQGRRFFGVLDLDCDLAEAVRLSVGVRNSIDQTLPMGFVAGNRVLVCDNLAFSGEILVSKRHTKNGQEKWGNAIRDAAGRLDAFRQSEAARIGHMRGVDIHDDHAYAYILRCWEKKIISHRELPDALNGWKNPAHDEFRPRTLWSLYNAITAAMAGKTEPATHAGRTIRLAALLAPSHN